jgi:prepilin-type N-terminal cleavage/methylation domain-containing protein/prepilin-type processing-associated H-X9-DG protein
MSLRRSAAQVLAVPLRRAFTLVELLVAVAIIGILIALLLPAIQAAREASRSVHCQNNLKQIGLALLTFHDQRQGFPSGGWGHEWSGIPTRGSSLRQPGGWIFTLLPYLEQQNLYVLGASGDASEATARLEQPLSAFTCTSRRPCQAWPIADRYAFAKLPKPSGTPTRAGRGDYAINSGSTLGMSFNGPETLADGDSATFSWPDMVGHASRPDLQFSGISHVRASISIRRITDGLSQTYLAGEKYLEPAHYETGESIGDKVSLYSGYCTDNHRFAMLNLPPTRDGSLPVAESQANLRFGGPHPGGVNVVLCDGSVHLIQYDVAPEVHYQFGHISDAGVVPTSP